MKQTKQTLQNKIDFLRETAADMAQKVSGRLDVKEQDFTEEVNKAFKAGCHVEIVLEDKKLQYDVKICTTSTLSSDSSADEVRRKVDFTKAEHPMTKRLTAIRENMVKKIMSAHAQHEAEIGEQKKMFAEDPRRRTVAPHYF